MVQQELCVLLVRAIHGGDAGRPLAQAELRAFAHPVWFNVDPHGLATPSRHCRLPDMKIRQLGRQGLQVSELGLGCMGMSDFYTTSRVSEAEAIALIHRALDLGINFLDTSDMYGPYSNE